VTQDIVVLQELYKKAFRKYGVHDTAINSSNITSVELEAAKNRRGGFFKRLFRVS
jgi:hypothetical protein